MNRIPKILFCLLLPAFVVAETLSPADTCMSLYRENRYAESVECLNRRVYIAEGRDTAGLVKLYEGLGVNYMMLDKKALAAAAFDRLLTLAPGYELDPNAWLPEIIALFQTVKLENKSRAETSKPAPVPFHLSACRYLPLGAPQFVKREKTKGFVMLALQAVSLGVSVYSHSKMRSLHTGAYGYPEEDTDRAQTYSTVYKITFFTFAAGYLYSLMDGGHDPAKEGRP